MADLDFGNAVTMPGQNTGMWGEAMKAGGGTQNPWDTFSNLTKDRNFLSLLAGAGAKLGYGGVGERLGVPVQQSIQSMATQEALGKGEAERGKWNKALFDLLSGGFTPKETPGPTSMKVGPDNITLDISTAKELPGTETSTQGAGSIGAAGPTGAAGPVGTPNPRSTYAGIPPGGGVATPKLNLTDALGFWQTPSR